MKSESLNSQWVLPSPTSKKLFDKLSKLPSHVGNVADSIKGFVTGADSVFIVESVEWRDHQVLVRSKATDKAHWIEKEALKPILKPRQVSHYHSEEPDTWVIWPYSSTGEALAEAQMINSLPLAHAYLAENKDRLIQRAERPEPWFRYHRLSSVMISRMTSPKLITGWKAGKPPISYDDTGLIVKGTGTSCIIHLYQDSPISLKALLGILNSSTISAYLKAVTHSWGSGAIIHNPATMDSIPLPTIKRREKKLLEQIETKVDERLKATKLSVQEQLEADINKLVEKLYRL